MKKILNFLLIILSVLSIAACSYKVDESIPQKIEENPPKFLEYGTYEVNLLGISDVNGQTFIKFKLIEDQNGFTAGEINSMPAAQDIAYLLPGGGQADSGDDFFSKRSDTDVCSLTIKDGTVASISLEDNTNKP